MIFISNSGFEVLNMSNKSLLVGSSIILSISTVPFIMSSAILIVAPKPILSIVSDPASGVLSTCWKWRMLRRKISFSIIIGLVIGRLVCKGFFHLLD